MIATFVPRTVVLVVALAAAVSRGTTKPLTEAHPGAAAQLRVDGAVNAELVCDLGEIGGTFGPVRSTPADAAAAFAAPKGWAFDSMTETGGTPERRLFVFLDATGEPVAEVVVARNPLPGPGSPPTTAPAGVEEGTDGGAGASDWLVVGVQACG